MIYQCTPSTLLFLPLAITFLIAKTLKLFTPIDLTLKLLYLLKHGVIYIIIDSDHMFLHFIVYALPVTQDILEQYE